MLSKTNRLTAREVREVLKIGRSARAGSISAKCVPAGRGKAAMVVSLKVAKSAVERNRLRRLGYASLPSILPKYHVVFFIQSREFEPADITTLCSKLS
jgi:ribonuclease P protein component